jgi:hypothetical protein
LNLKKLKKGRGPSRLAVSEVMGAVVMLAVTISVGFAAWAWARSAAINSERSFGNSIASNINCLNENFLITNVNFSTSTTSPLPNEVTVWYFNSGEGGVTIATLTVSYSNSTGSGILYTNNVMQASTTVAAGTGTQDKSGQAIIAVASTSGFAVGQKVELNTQGPRQEDLVIKSIGAGTITFTNNLQYTHPTGDTVLAPIISQGQISPSIYNIGQRFVPGTLYTFNSVAKCQGDIVSTYQQVR